MRKPLGLACKFLIRLMVHVESAAAWLTEMLMKCVLLL